MTGLSFRQGRILFSQQEKTVEFAPGDTVQIKSGGPAMTVERIGKDPRTQEDTVFCTWFDKVGNRQELHRESFSPVLLEKYAPAFGISTMRVERG
jgi:uncharacterized protein YodC (DUF2158 family)